MRKNYQEKIKFKNEPKKINIFDKKNSWNKTKKENRIVNGALNNDKKSENNFWVI